MRRVECIRLGWRLHPDALVRGEELLVPELSVRLQAEPIYGSTKVILAPFARCSVLPLFIARELGLAGTELGAPFADSLLPHLTLWLWRESHPIEVFGDSLGEYIAVDLPVAFDSSEKLDAVILGQHFFQKARVLLDVRGESSIETSPSP